MWVELQVWKVKLQVKLVELRVWWGGATCTVGGAIHRARVVAGVVGGAENIVSGATGV